MIIISAFEFQCFTEQKSKPSPTLSQTHISIFRISQFSHLHHIKLLAICAHVELAKTTRFAELAMLLYLFCVPCLHRSPAFLHLYYHFKDAFHICTLPQQMRN